MKFLNLKFWMFTTFVLFSGYVYAVGDTGKISELYVDQNGSIAVKLNSGFPNSITSDTCPTYNGWAESTTADPMLKSALLAAKTSNNTVTLSLSGCDAGGSWIKIIAVYVKEY